MAYNYVIIAVLFGLFSCLFYFFTLVGYIVKCEVIRDFILCDVCNVLIMHSCLVKFLV